MELIYTNRGTLPSLIVFFLGGRLSSRGVEHSDQIPILGDYNKLEGGDGHRRKGKKLTENCMISEELRPVRDISWEVKKIFSKICILGGGGGN